MLTMHRLFIYFASIDWLDLALLLADGLIATIIVLRLLFPTIPPGAATVWPARVLRLVLATAYMTVAVRVWTGWYWLPVDPSELPPHLLTLALVLIARGDMRALWRAIVQMHTPRIGRSPTLPLR